MKHPAKFSDAVLGVIAKHVAPDDLVLDPFAGTGRVHELDAETVGVEIEPEWASVRPATVVGNALRLPFKNRSFDVVATSPAFGNRMADSHNARDASKRITYTHTLGRKLHPDNSGAMQWGRKYQAFHVEAWMEARRVLRPGGRFILDISDHIRNGQVERVTAWHVQIFLDLGFEIRSVDRVETPRMRRGENHDRRMPYESVIVFDR